MRGRIALFLILLMSGFWVVIAEAKIARGGGGGGMRSGVGNRSAGVSRSTASRGNVSRGNVNRGNVNRQNVQRNVNRSDVNRNVNRDVNRDIDRDIDVDGGWGGGWGYDDNHWGWGSFAAGAAGAAVGAAIVDHDDYDSPDTVVITPPVGGYSNTLPSGCQATGGGGGTLYYCNGVYYEPVYVGSTLTYQVVQP